MNELGVFEERKVVESQREKVVGGVEMGARETHRGQVT